MADDIDPALKTWATPKQLEYIDAIAKHGGYRAAAREMGVHHTALVNAMRRLKRLASARGYSPEHDMTRIVPDGFRLRGTSTLYNKEGQIAMQWVKSQVDQDAQLRFMREAMEAMSEEVKGLCPPTPAPVVSMSDILTVYPMGDPHFGMLALAEESGANFDIKIAERDTNAAIDRLVQTAPYSERALLLNLGDMLHADNSSNRTPTSGHPLDVDTRHAKVFQTAVKSMVYAIRRLLEKHKHVDVWMMPGNHDKDSAFPLAICLSAFFDREPRVNVCLSPAHYRYMKFGQVLIGSTHGDGAKVVDLPGIMAFDRAKEWGETVHRYWYCGHIHHKTAKEYPGVLIETFRTLAPRDAWHASKGYRAGQDMNCIVLHKEHGEIERHRCDIGMIRKRK